MRRTAAVVVVLTACAGTSADRGTPTGTATTGDTDEREVVQPEPCSKGETFTMSFSGVAQDSGQAVVPGVQLTLEERNWQRGGTYGQATGDASGQFEITGEDMPLMVADRCWGTGVRFFLVGQTDELWGEKPLNDPMIRALEVGVTDVVLDGPIFLFPRQET